MCGTVMGQGCVGVEVFVWCVGGSIVYGEARGARQLWVVEIRWTGECREVVDSRREWGTVRWCREVESSFEYEEVNGLRVGMT